MDLRLVDVRRGSANKYSWSPFEPSDAFNAFDCWDGVPYLDDDPWYIQVLQGADEVGRVELDQEVGLKYYGAGHVEATALEIQFIEVAADRRGQGIGTQIVRQLEASHPDRTLVAFSEQADGFWESLGWQRYEHLTDPRYHRPLCVQVNRKTPSALLQPTGDHRPSARE